MMSSCTRGIAVAVSAMIGVLALQQAPEIFGGLVMIGPSPRYVDDGDYVGGFSRTDIAASAVIYGGMDARGIAFEGVDHALSVPTADLRLFGKPESYERRRMGVALARGDDTDQARERAREVAARVKPVRG